MLACTATIAFAALAMGCSGDDSGSSGADGTSDGGSAGSSGGGGSGSGDDSSDGSGGSSGAASGGGSGASGGSGGKGGSTSGSGGNAGDAGAAGAGGDTLPPAVRDFCDGMVDKMCDWMLRCRNFNDCEQAGPAPGVAAECDDLLPGRLARGEVVFHEERAEACLATRMVCSDSPSQLVNESECQGVLAGPGGIGDECYATNSWLTSACSEGYCDYADQCPGTCTAYADTGKSCDDRYCAPGDSCTDGVCVRLPRLGERCEDTCLFSLPCSEVDGERTCADFVLEGEACDPGGAPCVYPTLCVDGKCSVSVDAGAQCKTDSNCPSGYGCLYDDSSDTSSCQPWLKVDDECPGSGCNPADNLTCTDITPGDQDTTEHCARYASVNEPCEPAGCAQNLWCYYPEPDDPNAGVCRPRGGPGDSCESEEGPQSTWSSPCGTTTTEYFCIQGECATASELGEPCEPDNPATCLEGWCSADTLLCTEPAEEDEPCNPYASYETCAEGLYCFCDDSEGTCWTDPVENTGTCQPKKPLDALCASSDQCESDYCRWYEEDLASRCSEAPVSCTLPVAEP